ncbi:MAG: SDR family NAD(P)-dependent oxidoreductase [Bifidobacteriaceae bacterium]|jgi:NAD(P)-dependent dehydrogenase (short-subunit alcohol dehydrogenase family)|nr:SDR family NAD(P)-dependent oxidoreductase [Bifidobacteriaceae bacterium]
MTVAFAGDVIIVTGAGRGIGRGYALLAADRGARVVVNDYGGDLQGTPGDASCAEAVVAEIRRAGGTAIADATDVAAADAGERIVDAALRAWGRIDGIVNNAGVTRGGMGIEQNSDDDFLVAFQVHTMGSARLARAAWRHMKQARHGRIVNTSSDAVWGMPGGAYIAAKAANLGLTRALAAEGRRYGVLVNAVSPCAVTRMSPPSATGDQERVDRYLTAAGVAPLVVSLLRRECAVTGRAFQAGGNRAAETGILQRHHWHGEWNYTIHPAPDPKTQT